MSWWKAWSRLSSLPFSYREISSASIEISVRDRPMSLVLLV